MPGLIKYSCFKTHFISNAKKKKMKGKKRKTSGGLELDQGSRSNHLFTGSTERGTECHTTP
jgi:hypothetical protein